MERENSYGQVGSDITAAELVAITDHAKKYGHTSKIAKLDWLRECLQQRSLLPVAKQSLLDGTMLSAAVARQKVVAATKLQPAKTATLQATQVRFLDCYIYNVNPALEK